MVNRIKRLLKLATLRLLRSECFSRLAFSKTMWGLMMFFTVGVYFTINKLWTTESLDFFKFLGPFFFGVRAADLLTNISITKKDVSNE
jgi:hypothetical protein